jgi:hypothetical protein
MTNISIKTVIAVALAAAFTLSAYFLGLDSLVAHASAPSGLPATVATSSNPTIGTSGVVLFATSTCAARIITTVASPIMLTFSDYAGQTPTALVGHLQAASTTVVYDSGQYGCGLFKAYGFVSSAITVTETR